MKATQVILIAAFGLAALPALAQEKMDHTGHDKAAMMDTAPWAAAYDSANAVMHQGMAITYSDNPDLDFARGMVAHHQGAVEMAKIQLQFGTDPEMRALAQAIIDAQGPEIEQMTAFIAKMGG
ncbi:MAG: DUF305 domain-containing protein [Cypionkella sp.]|nr:DUF305 domain-containing protein [Cypionkella sp.]